MVSPEVLAEHRAQVIRLEEELEAERQHRRAADGEIIKLRAAMGGVQLSDSDVNALLPQAMESLAPAKEETIEEGEEEEERLDERYVLPNLRKVVFLLHFSWAACESQQSHWNLRNATCIRCHTRLWRSPESCVLHCTQHILTCIAQSLFDVQNTAEASS
jgi:hypothetical protein